MKLFRYKRDQFIDISALEIALQKYGQDGWELVTVTPVKEESGDTTILFVILKQEYES